MPARSAHSLPTGLALPAALALFVGLGASAFGQTTPRAGAPTSLLPSAQPAQTPAAKATAPAETTPRAMIDRINASLNGMVNAVGDFVQIAPDGKRTTGTLSLSRPGKLRFEYDRPTPVLVIADGRNVAVLDRKLGERNLYGIGQTPLKFLTAERIDVAKDATVLGVEREGTEVVLTIEDRNTVAGTSRIRIQFTGPDYLLKGWTITDPQGYDTRVSLSNLDLSRKPDQKQFVIDYLTPVPRDSN